MQGDARVRHCSLCNLNVYNFAEMTRDEVQALLQRSEGRVCGRLFRRADGTVLTRDCPTGLRALRLRASRVAAAIVASILSMSGVGCASRKPLTQKSEEVATRRVRIPQPAVLAGVVVCEGLPLPGATVRVVDETSKLETTVVADSAGAFRVNLLDGLDDVHLLLDGQYPATIEKLSLSSSDRSNAEIAVLPEATIGVIVTVVDQVRMDPLSTTFSQDFIQKMPL
jgi:hypothetical protein